VDEILRRCHDAGWVRTVWVVEKRLRALPHSVTVVGVRPKVFRSPKKRQIQELLASLEFVPDMSLFVITDGSLIRRLNKVHRARPVTDTTHLRRLARSERI
jgi:hypothetical protein